MKIYEFVDNIKEVESGGAYVEFPYDVEEEFGVKGRVKVRCDFEGIEYRGIISKMGTERHILIVLKSIREQLGKKTGDEIKVKLQKDYEERVVELHELLREKLAQDNNLQIAYDKLSYTKRKEMNLSIASAKREDTQLRRLEKALVELNS